MSSLSVLLVMHELTMAGSSRLALTTFQDLQGEFGLSIVANRAGSLEADFARLGDVTVLREGWLPRATRRFLGPTEAQAIVEWVHAQIRSRLIGPQSLNGRPGVVYVNSVAALPVYSHLRRVRRLACPTILHVHELRVMVDEIERLFPGMIRTIPDHYIAVSDAVADMLEHHLGVKRERITIARPRVDSRWLGHSRPPRESGHRFSIGGSGRPGWTKGADLWLQTVVELIQRCGRERFRFRWYGLDDGLESGQFRAMARKLRVDELVELVEFDPTPTIAYQSLDLMLVSSWEESASLVALEAMAVGTPVACFRAAGGPGELVGDAGLVIDDFSPAAMAESIEAFANSDSRLETTSRAAAQRVADHFGTRRNAEAVLEVIRQLAG